MSDLRRQQCTPLAEANEAKPSDDARYCISPVFVYTGTAVQALRDREAPGQ